MRIFASVLLAVAMVAAIPPKSNFIVPVVTVTIRRELPMGFGDMYDYLPVPTFTSIRLTQVYPTVPQELLPDGANSWRRTNECK
jgi:hypothetical protein